MTHTSQDISPLRQRMIDDMRMRKLAPKTHSFIGHCGRSGYLVVALLRMSADKKVG